ncbi:MAG: DUF2405 domain-containing protein [Methylococcaceae bacterium]|nr:DUF2405 domain-containing protein [Methylococcaceae bacterium]
MNITLDFLVDTEAVGILSKITLLVMQKDFVIVERSTEKAENEAQQHLIISLTYNYDKLTDEILDNLIQELKAIDQVHDVTKNNLKNKDSLLTISNSIMKKYPDIMGSIKEYTKKLDEDGEENKAAVLYEVGEIVGKKIAVDQYRKLNVNDSIAKGLKKIVLPVISPFALAKIKDSELHVSMCPFCMGADATATVPQCDFLTGLISGLLSTKQNVEVEEVKCRAQKMPACVFLISKKY